MGVLVWDRKRKEERKRRTVPSVFNLDLARWHFCGSQPSLCIRMPEGAVGHGGGGRGRCGDCQSPWVVLSEPQEGVGVCWISAPAPFAGALDSKP